MKDRITQFLKAEGISPAEFADKIGVQRSSVSHVLNGRNYPSASFIQKMLGAYQTLNSRWLLLGEGAIFGSENPSVKEPRLFEELSKAESSVSSKASVKPQENQLKDGSSQALNSPVTEPPLPVEPIHPTGLNTAQSSADLYSYLDDRKDVERIVFFFKDKTFAVYMPSK